MNVIVKSIKFFGQNRPTDRQLKVYLSNGDIVTLKRNKKEIDVSSNNHNNSQCVLSVKDKFRAWLIGEEFYL